MITGKHFRQILDKFLTSPTCQDARVQVQMPNGEFFDISEISLLENRILGTYETHRLVLKCKKNVSPMGKIIGKL